MIIGILNTVLRDEAGGCCLLREPCGRVKCYKELPRPRTGYEPSAEDVTLHVVVVCRGDDD